MTRAEDPRLPEAKALPIREILDRLKVAGLRPNGREMTGPCPLCGGNDRFNVNLQTHAFLCRRCDIKGGDTVALVMAVQGLAFLPALTWLCGDAPAQIDPAEMERRKAKADEAERQRQDEAARYRAKAIAQARTIWSRAQPETEDTAVRAYLEIRGYGRDVLPALPRALRFLPGHPCVKKIRGTAQTLHRGPCMIAGVLSDEGRIVAVHQTWIDLSDPKGKARIAFGGELQPSKMVRGSKKGGAIRLVETESDTLVMGEGIETTLAAFAAGVAPGASFWAGVDLGNMGGIAAKVEDKRYHGIPDMGDAGAFVPPPWVRRLIYLQDGDSDPRATRHRLECGLRRAMALRPGLKAQIAYAGDGVDFNDVLTGATGKRGVDADD